MRDNVKLTEAGQEYEAAHEAHYTAKDLLSALRLYKDLISAHPNALEAEYSRSQLQNIATSVVPKQHLLDAQVELALAHLEKDAQPAVEARLIMPFAADSALS